MTSRYIEAEDEDTPRVHGQELRVASWPTCEDMSRDTIHELALCLVYDDFQQNEDARTQALVAALEKLRAGDKGWRKTPGGRVKRRAQQRRYREHRRAKEAALKAKEEA